MVIKPASDRLIKNELWFASTLTTEGVLEWLKGYLLSTTFSDELDKVRFLLLPPMKSNGYGSCCDRFCFVQ